MTDRITKERRAELRDQLKFDLEHGNEKRSGMAADLLSLLSERAAPTDEDEKAIADAMRSELKRLVDEQGRPRKLLNTKDGIFADNIKTNPEPDESALVNEPDPSHVAPTSGEGEALIKHFENLAWTCRHDPVEVCEKCVRIKALILSAPKTVTREDIEKFVEGSIYALTTRTDAVDAVQAFLRAQGLRVEDKREGEDGR